MRPGRLSNSRHFVEDERTQVGVHLLRDGQEMHEHRCREGTADLWLLGGHRYSTTIFGAGRAGAFSATAIALATAMKAWASALPGAVATTGLPASDNSRMSGTSGISPRNGTPRVSAVLR